MEMVDDPTVYKTITKVLNLEDSREIRKHSSEPVDDKCFGWDS